MRKMTIMLGLLAALMTVALAGVADARQGADDPATHDVGDDRGLTNDDDPATHDVGDDNGVDDPATHDVGDDNGVDDPATHDVGDDNGSGGQGADDPVGQVRRSGDDGRRKRCRRTRDRAHHARRGDDNGGRRDRRCGRHHRGAHHGPNHR